MNYKDSWTVGGYELSPDERERYQASGFRYDGWKSPAAKGDERIGAMILLWFVVFLMILLLIAGANAQVAAPVTPFSAPGPPPNPSKVPWCASGQTGYLVEWVYPLWGTYPGGPPAPSPGTIYLGPSALYRFLSKVNGSLAQTDLICQVPINGQVTVK